MHRCPPIFRWTPSSGTLGRRARWGRWTLTEKRLNATDIPDFFIEGGIAVECKMKDKAKKMAVYAQVRRYAGHPEVKAIILATNISMGFPEQIEGKPVFLASLSAGWM